MHESFDPLSPEYLADPYAVLASLPLEEGPVFYAPSIGYYVVTRYADVMQVYGDPQTYSAAVAQQPLATLIPEAQQILLDGGHRPQPSMVSLDEPAHPRLRRPATRAFTVKRVNDMAPTIRATARELVDVVGDTDRFDLVAALAFPLPANAIFSLLGVPTDDYEQLKRWCGTARRSHGAAPTRTTRSRSPATWSPTAATCASWSRPRWRTAPTT